MNKILHNSYQNKHSLIVDGNLLCYEAPRSVALAALHELRLPASVLDVDSDLAEFRASWAAATSNQLFSLDARVAELAGASESNANQIAERVDELANAIQQQQQELAEARRVEWDKSRPERIDAEVKRRVEHVRAQGIRVDKIGEQIIRSIVENETD